MDGTAPRRPTSLAWATGLVLVLVLGCVGCQSAGSPGRALAVRVSGNRFVDQNGKVIQLRGVNRPGTEYRCAQSDSSGFVSDDNGVSGTRVAYVPAMVAALRSWNKAGATTNAINVVRIPLNEDCWLGINGMAKAYSGAAYRAFIQAEVVALTRAGMATILDLHWTAPGRMRATEPDVAPDADHSLTFWRQVAAEYRNQPSVMFDLFNEPRLWCYTAACRGDYATADRTAWSCYRNGCTYTYSPDDQVAGRTSGSFRVVGMQQLVTAIRQAGARNVILVGGLGYANALFDWVHYRPQDPAGQLAASVHLYPSSGTTVTDPHALDAMLASGGLSTRFPVFVGEFGEPLCPPDRTTGFAADTMTWADAHGYSYAAWGWDKGEGCDGPSLVTADSGKPSAYGAIVKAHLQARER